MKNTFIKIFLGLVIASILTVSIILLNFFIIGDIAEIDHLNLEITKVEQNKIDFKVNSMWSANAIKNFKYSVHNDVLSLSFNEVVVSDLHPLGMMDSSILGDFKNIKELRLVDNKNYRVVWQAETQVYIKKDYVTNLPVPFNVLDIDKIQGLKYTSGGSRADGSLCENTKNGFYGNYYLIDLKNKYERAGIITIFKEGQDMSKWTPSDTSQQFRLINLKTDILSVWDSIHVGIPQSQLQLFIKDYFNYKKGTLIHCEFDNYVGDFTILGDTLHELTIKSKCN